MEVSQCNFRKKIIVKASSVLLIVLIAVQSACFQGKALERSIGLKIENTPTRGFFYTDSMGTKYGMIYIESSITNLSPFSVELKFKLPYICNYPEKFGDYNYKVLLWTDLDTDELTEYFISRDLLKRFDGKDPASNHDIGLKLEPDQKTTVSIGVHRTASEDQCSATPYKLFQLDRSSALEDCEWTRVSASRSKIDSSLGLMLGYCTVGGDYEACEILPAAYFSFSST